jgi:hypothetical protein
MSAAEDDPKNPGRRQRPDKVVHTHDEFELDITLDTGLTRRATQEVLPDLFDDLEEEATEMLTLPGEVPLSTDGPRSEERPVSTALEQEVLPVFMPMTPPPARKAAPRPPPPTQTKPTPRSRPPPSATPPPARRGPPPAGVIPPPPPDFRASVEDLSSGIFEMAVKLPQPGARGGLETAPLPGPGENSDPALEPLDISQFAMSHAGRKKTSGLRPGLNDARGETQRGAAPMAQPQRVVRTVFTIGLREVLLFLLLLLLGAGLWTGWSIYQDYSRRQDLERLEAQRDRLEDARRSALGKGQNLREKDIP